MAELSNTEPLKALFDIEMRIVAQAQAAQEIRARGGDTRAVQQQLDELVRMAAALRNLLGPGQAPLSSKHADGG